MQAKLEEFQKEWEERLSKMQPTIDEAMRAGEAEKRRKGEEVKR